MIDFLSHGDAVEFLAEKWGVSLEEAEELLLLTANVGGITTYDSNGKIIAPPGATRH